MRRSRRAVKADARRRIELHDRSSVAKNSQELGIQVITLSKGRKA